MSQKKNDTPALLLALLVTLGLLGGGAWLLAKQFGGGGGVESGNWPSLPNGGNNSGGGPVKLSTGERSLISTTGTSQKQAGINAYAQGNYSEAAQQFQASLQQSPNDPESVIFRGNALAVNGPTLTVGASLPITSDQNAALEMMRGIAQAQQEINSAGGINGQKLLIAMADDNNDNATAQQVAQGFGKDQSVVGVVGPYSSGVSIATLDAYKAAQLPNISPVSTSVELSNASPYFFRTVPSDYIAARALAEYSLSKLQRQRAVVYFNSGSAYSQSLKGEFATAFSLGGGQVISEVDLSQSGISLGSTLSTAQQQGADVIVLLPNTGTLNQALQVIAVNDKALPVIGGDDVYSATTLEVGRAAAEEMVVAIPWHIDASPDPSFPGSSRNLWSATVNWRTALSYDAVQAIAAGLRTNPSRAGVQQALKSPNFQTNGASGSIRFLPSGDRNASIQLVTVEPGSGPGGYTFVPVP